MKLQVVVGAQFGSEGKGHVVQRLTKRAIDGGSPPQVVRVAGPNAGHTGYDPWNNPWALRQVPVAAVVPGHVVLGIAPGSEIDMPVLLDEIDRLTEAGLMRDKLFWISGEATLIQEGYKGQEATEGLVDRIGSTGKGVGAARSARIWRGASRLMDDQAALTELKDRGVAIGDSYHTPAHTGYSYGTLILEGTQGYGLGLHAGFYPKCTSSDCRAVDFMSMAGVNAWEFESIQVWAVARVYPIRVAGDSGPLKEETSWEALGLPEERTTVTKKIRRVGEEDWELVARAVRANGGSPWVRLALTMLDQKFPQIRDHQLQNLGPEDKQAIDDYLGIIERRTKASVQLVTTAPNSGYWR